MQRLSQSPTDPGFVQNPYPFYAQARACGDLVWWDDYAMPAATSHAAVSALLRDRRFGREVPAELAQPVPERLAPFYAVEAHSMLEAEPPRHTRLRGLVLRAFTSARIAALEPQIDALAHQLVAGLRGKVDLLDALCRPLPVRVIARLLGVPEDSTPDLLGWSNAMVGMYQAGRSPAMEDRAVAATLAFRDWLARVIAARRNTPGPDLLSQLIAAESAGDRLTPDELVSTVILLLNAGHEATVHTLGNGIRTLIETGTAAASQDPVALPGVVEEVLRHDPPLHMFTRIAYAEVEVFGHRFRRGDRVALLLGAANRDPAAYADPDRFNPGRFAPSAVSPSDPPHTTPAGFALPHTSFGAGLHFCVGAPLARLEIACALRALFAAHPGLTLAEPPRYAPIYHFHGLERLMVDAGSGVSG